MIFRLKNKNPQKNFLTAMVHGSEGVQGDPPPPSGPIWEGAYIDDRAVIGVVPHAAPSSDPARQEVASRVDTGARSCEDAGIELTALRDVVGLESTERLQTAVKKCFPHPDLCSTAQETLRLLVQLREKVVFQLAEPSVQGKISTVQTLVG